MRLTIPKLRMWHLLGIVAASAVLFSVMQFRWSVEDEGYGMIRRLRSADAGERAKAANGLGLLRPREHRAIAPLTEMLLDTDARARTSAAEALLYIMMSSNGKKTEFDEAQIAPVKAALTSALGDSDPRARLAIAHTLVALGGEAKVVVPTLLELAGDPRTLRARADAVSLLGQYARQSEPAMAALFAALNDTDALVRTLAVNSLAYDAVVPDIAPEPLMSRINTAIIGASGDGEQSVRLAAVNALARMGRRTKTEDPRVIRSLSDTDAQVRSAACMYVAWGQPRKNSSEFIQAIERTLKDPDSSVRQSAAFALGKLGLQAETSLPSLRAAINDPDKDVQSLVTKAIASIEQDAQKFRSETLPRTIAELADADSTTRALAAGRLEDFGPRASEAVPALVRCLADREPDVRRAAAGALAQLGPDAAVAVPTLATLAESDPDERVRRAATISRSILLRDQARDQGR